MSTSVRIHYMAKQLSITPMCAYSKTMGINPESVIITCTVLGRLSTTFWSASLRIHVHSAKRTSDVRDWSSCTVSTWIHPICVQWAWGQGSSSSNPTLANHVFMENALCTGLLIVMLKQNASSSERKSSCYSTQRCSIQLCDSYFVAKV